MTSSPLDVTLAGAMRPDRATPAGCRLRVLFIAPLPPPITGHSVASAVLLEELARRHDVTVVNLSLGSSNDGSISRRRVVEVWRVLRQVAAAARGVDAVYLTISESLAGNAKDLCIYLLCRGRLPATVVHLHGGSIRRLLFDRHAWVRALNARFLRRVGAAIISGRSHDRIFEGMVEGERLHHVPNFAHDGHFLDEAAVRDKFAADGPLRVLYVSGMTRAKGYAVLLDAWLALPPAVRARARLDLAGKFDSAAEHDAFVARIAGIEGVRYHGLVDDARKCALFAAAHVFCLPTSHLEGQPISILEAYASGCAVVTTGQPGIRDVFADGVHGVEMAAPDAPSLARALERALADRGTLARMAAANRALAESKYRTTTYTHAVASIIEAATAAPPPGGRDA